MSKNPQQYQQKSPPSIITDSTDKMHVAMDAIFDTMALPLYQQGFAMSPAIRVAEERIVSAQQGVLQGTVSLFEYGQAVWAFVDEVKRSGESSGTPESKP